MIKDLLASQHYAAALFPLIEGKVECALSIIGALCTAMKDHDVLVFLSHPRITLEQKQQLVHGISGIEACLEVERLVMLLIERRKTHILPLVLNELHRLWLMQQRIAQVEVRSAFELSAELREQVSNRLASALQSQVQATFIIDERLIAGLSVRKGTAIIDTSLKAELDDVRVTLLGKKLGAR
jgi:F-type H+-transporting ATPase subunit delta